MRADRITSGRAAGVDFQGFKGAQLAVLLHLSAMADPDGLIQAGGADIAEAVGVDLSTVRRAISALADQGAVRTACHAKGPGLPAIYEVQRAIEFNGQKDPDNAKRLPYEQKKRGLSHSSVVRDAFGTAINGVREFLEWAKHAQSGNVCIYHLGQIGFDRSKSADLDLLAQTVGLFQEHQFVSIGQHSIPIVAGRQIAYTAVRTGGGRAPKYVLNGKITAIDYQALKIIILRSADMSAARALRYGLAVPEKTANAILDGLKKRKLVVAAEVGKGMELSDAAKRMAL